MKYKDWQDEGGFFHIQHSPSKDGSENGPLFTAEVALFSKLNEFDLAPIDIENLKVSDVDFRDRFNGSTNHFSHDNMTGLYCLKELGFHNMELPIIRWNSRGDKYWLHPRDILFYSILKYKILSPLAMFLIPISIVSYIEEQGRTSGKCMWFTRFGTMTLSKNPILSAFGKLGFHIGNFLMKKQHGDKPFQDAFEIYFKNDGHPCREEIRRIYE